MTLSKSPGYSNKPLESLTKIHPPPSFSDSCGWRNWIRVALYRIETLVWNYVEDMVLSGFSNQNKYPEDITLGSPFGTRYRGDADLFWRHWLFKNGFYEIHQRCNLDSWNEDWILTRWANASKEFPVLVRSLLSYMCHFYMTDSHPIPNYTHKLDHSFHEPSLFYFNWPR